MMRPAKLVLLPIWGMLICGTSGGGKSMTTNHLIRSLYDQGAHCVIVDIGGSYVAQCELVKGYYFTYEESNPIRFNPFYFRTGEYSIPRKREPEGFIGGTMETGG
jgi:GTPase SAR1 family protein